MTTFVYTLSFTATIGGKEYELTCPEWEAPMPLRAGDRMILGELDSMRISRVAWAMDWPGHALVEFWPLIVSGSTLEEMMDILGKLGFEAREV